MVIQEASDTIFIHVPKCAGTSVKTALRSCGFDLLRLDDQMDDVYSGFYKHGTAARMHRHLERDFWQRSLKFAVCRNPYDRLVSGWHFVRAKLNVAVPFDYFARHLKTYRGYFIDWHCVMPQRQHLLIDGLPVADHICRFEHLDQDFEVIRRRLGRPDLRLSHLNPTAHEPYRAHYTRQLQEIVFEHFAVDFEYFGYDSDL
jgi:hypothetical protein